MNATNILLEIKNLNLKKDDTHLILGISNFTLHSGEFLHLVGPSGSGKSLFLKSLIYLFPIKFETYNFQNIPIENQSIYEVRRKMLYLNQFPDLGDLKIKNIYEQYANLKVYRPTKTSPTRWNSTETKSLMETLNFDWNDWLDRSAQHLSGGELQILQHSLAVAADPLIYLLDETLSAIDQARRKIILNFYIHQVKKKQKSIILIDHQTLEQSSIVQKNFLSFTTHT